MYHEIYEGGGEDGYESDYTPVYDWGIVFIDEDETEAENDEGSDVSHGLTVWLPSHTDDIAQA